MKKTPIFLSISVLILLFSFSILAQKNIQVKDPKTKQTKENALLNHGKENFESDENEAKYRAPVRYVIVYNDVFETGERRIEVLLDKVAFNKKTLISVFNLLIERFPAPARLEVDVNVDLAMIETPEEREMLRDGNDSRFSNQFWRYRTASFTRFENGREAFVYTTSLSPYLEKTVVLVDK